MATLGLKALLCAEEIYDRAPSPPVDAPSVSSSRDNISYVSNLQGTRRSPTSPTPTRPRALADRSSRLRALADNACSSIHTFTLVAKPTIVTRDHVYGLAQGRKLES